MYLKGFFKIPAASAVLIVLLVAGCTTTPEQDAYTVAMESGDSAQAYRILASICETDPKASECKELPELSTSYATLLYNNLSSKVDEAAPPVVIPKIIEFKDELSSIKAISNVSGLTTLEKKIGTVEKETQGRIEKALESAKSKEESGDRVGAFDSLKTALVLDPDRHQDFEVLVKRLSDEAFAEGSEAGEADDWAGAHKAFSDLYYIDPEYKGIDSALEEAKKKDSYAYRVTEGKKAEGAGDFNEALDQYAHAAEYQPGKELDELINGVTIASAEAFFDEGKALAREGMLLIASINIIDAIERVTELPKNMRARVSVPAKDISRLMDELFLKQKSEAEAGNYGKALLCLEAIDKIQPDYPDISANIESVTDKLKKKATQSLAVIPFKSPSYNPDTGNIITSKLLHFLYNELSGDIRILERAALEAVLKESEVKALQGKRLDKGLIQIVDADFMLLGDVVDQKVENSVTDSYKTVKARTGTNQTSNPEYVKWSKKKKGEAPPEFFEEAIYEKVRCRTARHKKEVTAIVGYRLVDGSGDIVHTGMIDEKEELSDTSVEGVEIGEFIVEEKLAELPSDSEASREVENMIVSTIGLDLKSLFSEPEKKYFEKARVLADKGKYNEALEFLVRARFITDEKSLDSKEIDDAIADTVKRAGM
ncbi:MAG: hypothetical protein KAR06_01460 [Deltaproteobacteria bacterium]|nr:hypothetical protein [Deltaproteobacteria bacterium]